jgi:hypothetical protein
VLRGAWQSSKLSSISFSLHRTMHRFGDYYLGCASGGWSDLSRVIGRDNFLSVCLGSFHDRMLYSIFCCYLFYRRLCHAVAEDHSGYVVFVFGIHLVSPFVNFSFCHRMHSSWSLSCWLDQLSHFEHQKVGKNTYGVLIQMLSVGLGASIFTFLKTCVERYES